MIILPNQDKLTIQKRIQRICKKRKIWKYEQPIKLKEAHEVIIKKPPFSTNNKLLYLNDKNEKVSVEELALEFYNKNGFEGMHCEGRIFTSIFGNLI